MPVPLEPQFSIQTAGPEAAAEIMALIHEVFTEYGFSWEPEEEFWDFLGERYPYAPPGGNLWVMRTAAGVLVGSVAAELISAETVELHRLYLKAELRGQGHGRRLLQTAEAWGRAHGASEAVLWSDTNFLEAHKLYLRSGYSQEGERILPDANQTVEYRFHRPLPST